MIIGGGSRSRPSNLADHLLRTDENEIVRLVEIGGVAAKDLHSALKRMQAVAALTGGRKGLYHASIDPDKRESMTPQQWARSVDVLEKKLGLEGQPRAVVYHLKKGEDGEAREHIHVVWQRTDIDTLTLRDDSFTRRKQQAAAITLEREFGHAPAPRQSNRQSLTKDELQQAKRTRIDPKAVAADLTEAWESTRNGQEFKEAAEAKGYVLVCGDRRDFVVIDGAGGTHSVARRIKGVKAKDVRDRFADLSLANLPTAQDGRRRLPEAKEVFRPASSGVDDSASPERSCELSGGIGSLGMCSAIECASESQVRDLVPVNSYEPSLRVQIFSPLLVKAVVTFRAITDATAYVVDGLLDLFSFFPEKPISPDSNECSQRRKLIPPKWIRLRR